MIEKRPWSAIVGQHTGDIFDIINSTKVLREKTIKEINNMILGEKLPINPIVDPFDNMKDKFLVVNARDNVWFSLPIVISTLKLSNNTIFYKIREEISYLYGYVSKLIETNYGSEETRGYDSNESKERTSNVGDIIKGTSSSSSDESITPQLGQVAFDENTLDFRSSMERLKGTNDSNRNINTSDKSSKHNTHSETKSKISFDEQRKLDVERYTGVITDYVNRIPYIIYDFYSLDVTPPEMLPEILGQ